MIDPPPPGWEVVVIDVPADAPEDAHIMCEKDGVRLTIPEAWKVFEAEG